MTITGFHPRERLGKICRERVVSEKAKRQRRDTGGVVLEVVLGVVLGVIWDYWLSFFIFLNIQR